VSCFNSEQHLVKAAKKIGLAIPPEVPGRANKLIK
jgi:hypothetical protein